MNTPRPAIPIPADQLHHLRSTLSIAEVDAIKDERDRARRIAVSLEQELAELQHGLRAALDRYDKDGDYLRLRDTAWQLLDDDEDRT